MLGDGMGDTYCGFLESRCSPMTQNIKTITDMIVAGGRDMSAKLGYLGPYPASMPSVVD
jgi:hypothetical protein